MSCALHFANLAEYGVEFIYGAFLTASISLGSILGGIAIGIAGALIRYDCQRGFCYWIVTAYVELVRNTPFIIQLFSIFFGLSQIGICVEAECSAILALTLNLGAYATEIIRSYLLVTPNGQWEACRVLGMTYIQAYFHVVLPPAMKKAWPALTGQCVLVMLGSAVISQISCEDLSYAASYAQSMTFLPLESYLIATVGYIVLSWIFRHLMMAAGRLIFRGA
ncbi:MAG: amino acid ABC transporter permease [Desulfovibrionaceae bacterium]|nr:amino acid ABC transporter permease [Desulfovibrionaceae bacterium]